MIHDANMHSVQLHLQVVLFRERAGAEDVWVAQCLEYDIAAQGKDLDEAKSAFERTFAGEVLLALESGEVPLASVPPAPRRFREMFARALRLADVLPLTPVPEDSPVVAATRDLPRGIAELRIAS